jgi:CBS domain-containing protein
MTNFEEHQRRTSIAELVSHYTERELPIIREDATVEEVIQAMIHFKHSRLLYVVDDSGQLTGTISLGILVRQVFSRSHVPQIHPRRLVSMITTESAKHIMQKSPIYTVEEEEVGVVLERMIATNVKEIAVLDREKRVIGDITMIDLLAFLMGSAVDEG